MAPPKSRQKSETGNSPNFWDRWIPTLKSIGKLGLTSGIVAAVLAGAYSYLSDYVELRIDKRIDNKLGVSTEKSETKLQPIADKLSALGERVAKMEGRLEELRIQRLAMQPKMGASSKQVSEILNTAKKSGTQLAPEVIADAGRKFISAAGNTTTDLPIWNAALAFLDYRSFLNVPLTPPTTDFIPVEEGKRYEWGARLPIGPGAKFHFTHGKSVPADKAAIFELIGKPMNIDKSVGNQFILLEGSTGRPEGWKLDGYRLRNVIFRDSKITYEGGPIDLQNVYFVNCTFNVARQPNGKNFASTFLASTPETTFGVKG